MSSLDARACLLVFAQQHVGRLYAWGGESSLEEGGFDCSGFASVALKEAARLFPELYDGGRRTAQGLFDHYRSRGVPEIRELEDLTPGCLVFYRRPGHRIHHVAIHFFRAPSIELGGRSLEVGPVALEAGGSGSAATSPRQALLASASVRPTASDSHGSGVEWIALDPFTLLEQ